MKLKKLTRPESTKLSLMWDDGHVGPVTLVRLRDACPCAGCQGETILLHHYAPPERKSPEPGTYDLKAAEVVGNYALRPTWGDGHDQGIYTWEHLRALCECEQCSAQRSLRPGRGGSDE